MLNELAKKIHLANVEKGFYEDNANVMEHLVKTGTPEMVETFKKAVTGQRLALITSEISEVLEGDRKDQRLDSGDLEMDEEFKSLLKRENDENFKQMFFVNVKDTVEDETADILIRVLDFCGANNIDIQFHVEQKLRYNSLRPHKQGKTY